MTTDPNWTTVFRDRFTGSVSAAPNAAGTLIGRWVFEVEGQKVCMNSVAVSENDFLVPEPSGKWYVFKESGERLSGAAVRAQIVDELEADSVRTIGDRLEEICRRGGSWIDWLAVVPLVPGISDQVNLQSLEVRIRKEFGHIETACRKPHAHLHVKVERVPVSRARRIPIGAAAYLGAHTEDWDRRLVAGVLPKRILAETRHEQLDIYENRVVARLLDNLMSYLNRRIRVLKRLLKIFRQKEDYSGVAGGTYQRRHRITELWGESIDANEGRRKAEANLKELGQLKYRLMSLFGSALYEEVSRRAYVPTTLRSTNILTNDQHYRRIPMLWREWARIGAERPQSPRELNEQAQRLCRGMDAFSMVLVVRALGALGYEPSNAHADEPIVRGTDICLHGHGIEPVLRWRMDGTIAIKLGEHEMVIVPLAMDLRAGTDEQPVEALAQLSGAAPTGASRSRLVLYLASDDNRPAQSTDLGRSLHTVGNDPRNARSGGGCLPVSPWEIGSTERVARALRWFLTSARFRDYPLQVDVPEAAQYVLGLDAPAPWLFARTEQNRRTVVEVRRPPADHEWRELDLNSLLARSRAELADAQKRHQNISEELRQAVRKGSTGLLNQQKRDAHRQVERCESKLEALQVVESKIRDACDWSMALLVCPICGTKADPARDFMLQDRGCFRCECRGCGTKWSTRLCSSGHRYAAMLPSGDFAESDDIGPGWEDRVYGGDLLALPARGPDGRWGFVCPECGRVS